MSVVFELSGYEQVELAAHVAQSHKEDVGGGDITAQLVPESQQATASVITREEAVLCGQPWAEVFAKVVDPGVELSWQYREGESLPSEVPILTLCGPARSMLTLERGMLNFLQTLMGTATTCSRYAARVAHTGVKLLDTRKTIPGLRAAQKYAVRVGGCYNHRIGLFDAFLIKENHIQACGSISLAVEQAKQVAPGKPIEVEVESFEEYKIAESCGVDTIMLDNFSASLIYDTVRYNQSKNQGAVKLEASGGITETNLVDIAETGVDYISLGSLTKHLHAIDLSMRFNT